jgi:hypothetical protein
MRNYTNTSQQMNEGHNRISDNHKNAIYIRNTNSQANKRYPKILPLLQQAHRMKYRRAPDLFSNELVRKSFEECNDYSNVTYALNKRRVSIGEIKIDRPYMRYHNKNYILPHLKLRCHKCNIVKYLTPKSDTQLS